MFSQKLPFLKSFLRKAHVHYNANPWSSPTKITNIFALYNNDQSDRWEGYSLISNQQSMTSKEKTRLFMVHDNHKLSHDTYSLSFPRVLWKICSLLWYIHWGARLKLLRVGRRDRFCWASKCIRTYPCIWWVRQLIDMLGALRHCSENLFFLSRPRAPLGARTGTSISRTRDGNF